VRSHAGFGTRRAEPFSPSARVLFAFVRDKPHGLPLFLVPRADGRLVPNEGRKVTPLHSVVVVSDQFAYVLRRGSVRQTLSFYFNPRLRRLLKTSGCHFRLGSKGEL
jgi:hypothetical protein